MNKLKDIEKELFNKTNPAVRFSVSRYVLAIGLFVAVFAFGILSTMNLGVDSTPSVNMPMVVVSTTYSGAAPAVVNEQVTKVIENAVGTASGISEINSTSMSGESMVMIRFEDNVDKNSATNQVSSLISAVVGALPDGASTPTTKSFDPNSQAVIQFGISGGEKSLTEVSDYVNNELTTSLQHINGVASVSTSGTANRQFQILLNPNYLSANHINPYDVVSAVASASVNDSIGSITINQSVLTFATKKVPASLDDISKILVNNTKGIRVGDLGTIRDSSSASTYARVNGKPVILVSVKKNTDANSVAVAQSVRQLIETTTLPTGYSIIVSNDTTGSISASVNSTIHELIVTLFVVAIIVLLFIGKLSTVFSVLVSIPIALSAAPTLYNLLGFTFNMVSLLAMIVAIGVVVDDAIVVAENVERYRKMGYKLKDAVLKGTSEVFSAVVAASLSILSVLIPVSFVGGFVGGFLQQFAAGLIAAVLLSLLDAILFLTVRLAYLPELKEGQSWQSFGTSLGTLGASLKWAGKFWRSVPGVLIGLVAVIAIVLTKQYWFLVGLPAYPIILAIIHYGLKILVAFLGALTETLHGLTEKVVVMVRDAYGRVLKKMLRRSALVLIVILALMGGILVIVIPHISFNFMPQTDNNSISVDVQLANGTPLSTTNQVVAKLETYLAKQPEVLTTQSLIGGSDRGSGSSSSNRASINVTMVSSSKRQDVYTLIAVYRNEILKLTADQADSNISVSAGGGFQGQGSAVSLSLVSSSDVLLNQANTKILQLLRQNEYVQDVSSSLSNTSTEQDFVPDESRLSGTGISPSTLSNNLKTYTTGIRASTISIDGLDYPITVKLDSTYLTRGKDSLNNLPIYSSVLGTSLQVGQLGDFQTNQAPVSLSRFNKLYTAELTINLKRNAPAIMAFQNQIKQQLQDQGIVGNGVSLSAGSSMGMAALAGQLMSSGTIAFLMAFALAYLVMAAQFNSWRYPIYLLMPVPLAIIGALIVVAMTGGAIDIFGVMGMLLLIGLSAKNAILYLDFVVDRIKRMPLTEALLESAVLRFRPIIMTTLTVLVISGPLVFGSGEGSEYGKSLGTVMFGGILFSAILTFFVVPAAFQLFEKKRIARDQAQAQLDELDNPTVHHQLRLEPANSGL